MLNGRDNPRGDYTVYYRFYHDENDVEHVSSIARWLTRCIASHLPTNTDARVLDIGCGMGFALLGLRQLGFQNVLGIDIDPGQIEVAHRWGLPVKLVTDTVKFLESPQVPYDVVLLLDVIEHIPKDEQIPLLQAIYRVLTPSGCLIVQAPNANAIVASRWLYNDFTHYCSFTEHSLRFVLINAGFEKIDIQRSVPPRRPSLRLWRRSARDAFWPDLIRYFWYKVLETQIGHIEDVDNIPLDLNLFAVASKTLANDYR